MRLIGCFCFIGLFLLSACSDQSSKNIQEAEQNEKLESVEEKPLKDRLPRENRKAYLEPLENSFDNLSELIDQNILLETDTMEVKLGEGSGRAVFYKDEGLPAKRTLVLSNGEISEKHWWYYNNKGKIYKSEHRFMNLHFGADGGKVNQAILFYYEDDGLMLSSYEKLSFEGRKFTEKWRQNQFDPQQLDFIWKRIKLVNGLVDSQE